MEILSICDPILAIVIKSIYTKAKFIDYKRCTIMRDIQIHLVSQDNWEEAMKVSVYPEQAHYVPSVTESLAYAYLKPWDEALDPFVISNHDKIIGFFFLSYTPHSLDNYWIGGFQIDNAFQGKGYGKQAMAKILSFIKQEHPHCQVISLTVEPSNEQARRLYEQVGFVSEHGRNQYGEMIYRYKICM